MRFEDIPGLDDIKSKLVSSVKNNNLAHAILLSGKSGSWNLPIALAFSAFIHCENPGESDSCGECTACSQHKNFVHPDLNFVFPLTSQKGVKTEDLHSRNYLKPWRKFLLENPYLSEEEWAKYIEGENKSFNISKTESRQIIQNLSLKSFTGGYKIMLVWLPEYMNQSSANGILKILEEPAEKTLFLLVSQDSEQLLSTIISRTRQIAVRNPVRSELASWFVKYNGVSENEAANMTLSGNDNISQILKNIHQNDDAVIEYFRNWLLACYRRDLVQIPELSEQFGKMSKVLQRAFFTYGQNVLRDCNLVNFSGEDRDFISEKYKEFIVKLAALLNITKIELISQLFSETVYHLERNSNPKVSFLNLSVKMTNIFRA